MPDKKKNPKVVERGSEPTTKSKRVETIRPAGSAAAIDGQKQLSAFEAAMKLFHARKLKEARDVFERATEGPERDVAQRARLHIRMCDRRLEQSAPVLRSTDDYYNYGVALLNSRNIAAAREHLEIALRMSPRADHVLYALGVARAISGDLNGAYENLKQAIELEPRNRLIARQDADLGQLGSQPPLDGLLFPEKKSW